MALLRRLREPLKGGRMIFGNPFSTHVEIRQVVFALWKPSLCRHAKPFCRSSYICGHPVAEKGHPANRVRSAGVTPFCSLPEPTRGRFEVTVSARTNEIARTE